MGNFTYALFDLVNDPYETTNLYDSEDEAVSAGNELQLPNYHICTSIIVCLLISSNIFLSCPLITAKQELYALIVDYNDNSKEDVVNTMETRYTPLPPPLSIHTSLMHPHPSLITHNSSFQLYPHSLNTLLSIRL